MNKNIILASTSSYRAQLLKQIHVKFDCIGSNVDEDKIKLDLNDPVDIGSFDAVGGVYVTPTNRLVIYSGAHDNNWPVSIVPPDPPCPGDDRCRSLEMGEFASQYYHPPVVIPQADEEVFTYKTTLFVLGSFTDTEEDDQIWEVEIDWGDGNTEQVARTLPGELGPVEHRYRKPGEYSVTMLVTDMDGFSGTSSFEVIATEYVNGDGGGGGGGGDSNIFGCTIGPNIKRGGFDPTLISMIMIAFIYIGMRHRKARHSL